MEPILKIQWVQQITVSNTYCIQQFTVSSKILCPHLLLIYTCSTFPCLHIVQYSAYPFIQISFRKQKNWHMLILASNNLVFYYIIGEIYNTVLTVYSHEDDKPLPQSDEVLLCTPHTTLDMVTNCVTCILFAPIVHHIVHLWVVVVMIIW